MQHKAEQPLTPPKMKSVEKKQGHQRTRMNITCCPHTEREHYSKGMCKYCYNYFGKVSLATQCPHPDRMVYAHGKCQKCYINHRNAVKRAKQISDRAGEANKVSSA